MTHYLNMTKAQAEAALQEFLDERGLALERLRQALSADGRDLDAMLDGTPQGLIALWGWVLNRLTGRDAPAATDPATVSHDDWPSWERFTTEAESVLSYESVQLLDGFISYLVRVVEERTPGAQWQIGQHPNKRYQFRHHPVLAANDHQVFFPAAVATKARRTLQGATVPDDALAVHAEAVIAAFAQEQELDRQAAEPLVEVEDLGDDAIRGRELELGFREDREILLVATPTWSTSQP